VTTGEETPLKKRDIYKEDWIGLKTLDEKGGLVFLETEGAHVRAM
jgi:palmitoyl-protein thioesterase